MRMTSASRYAIRAIAFMAARKDNRIIPSHKIAKACHIPKLFLLKVLKPLVSAGVLSSIKGPSGGFRLAKPAQNISLLQIIEAVDGPVRGEVPFIDGKDTGKVDGRLGDICDRAAEGLSKHLRKIRISELAR